MIPGLEDILGFAIRMLPIGSSIIDIGPGNGEVSRKLVASGMVVTGYGIDQKAYDKDIRFVYGRVEDLDRTVGVFNAIWCSHVLEHSMDVGRSLLRLHSVLDDSGWLFLSVPPHKHEVVGGHVSTGWNIGQLMYSLILTGFDVRCGHFVKHGYNVSAFVKKRFTPLPKLNCDLGDIELLKDFWPDHESFKHGFNGNMVKWNWPPNQAPHG